MPRSTSLWTFLAGLGLVAVTLWLLSDDASPETQSPRRGTPAMIGARLVEGPAVASAPAETWDLPPIARHLAVNATDREDDEKSADGEEEDATLRIAIYGRSPLELDAYAMIWPGPPPSNIETLDVGLLDDADVPVIESALFTGSFEAIRYRIPLSRADARALRGVELDDPEMKLVMVISEEAAVDDHRAEGKPIWVTVHRPGGGVQTIIRRVAPSEELVTLAVDMDGWVWSPDFQVPDIQASAEKVHDDEESDLDEPMTIQGWYAGDLLTDWTFGDGGNGFGPLPDGNHPFALNGSEEGRLHWSMVDVKVTHGKETVLLPQAMEDLVRGRVCDEAGRPVESKVRVEGRGGMAEEFDTRDDGSFRITGNLVGMESFRVTPLESDRYGIVIVPPPRGRDFDFVVCVPTHADRLVNVALNLRDGQGKWVNSHVACTLIGKDSSWVTWTQVLSAGCVSYYPGMCLTPPGSYELWVWMPEAAMFASRSVEVETYQGGRKQTIRVVPKPSGGIVKGRIKGFDRYRYSQLWWYLRPPDEEYEIKPSSSFTTYQSVADDGAFELKGLPMDRDFVIDLRDRNSVLLTIHPPTLVTNQPIDLGDIRLSR